MDLLDGGAGAGGGEQHVVAVGVRRLQAGEELLDWLSTSGVVSSSRERIAFAKACLKLRPSAIASPTDFMWVVSVGSAPWNFSKAKRGHLTTT